MLVRDQVVAVLLQLVARVGDEARFVEVIGAEDEAEVAVATRVLGEGDGQVGDLLERVEAGAAREFGERLLIGLRFERQLLDLGGGGAGPKLGHVDARHHARGGRKRRQAALHGQRAVRAAALAAAAAGRDGGERDEQQRAVARGPCGNSAADVLDSHAVQRRAGLGARR